MTCPKCDGKTTVMDGVHTPSGSIHRKRKCKACGHRFYTSESIVTVDSKFLIEWSDSYRDSKKSKRSKGE